MPMIKTHLIVTGQEDNFKIKWVKRLIDTNPVLDAHSYPTFVVTSNCGRMEMKTFDMQAIEKQAKKFTLPKGRGAVTTDKSYIYIKEEKGEVLIGIVIHDHIRHYAQMYDEL